MEENQNENRPSVPTWVWILTVFAVILGLQLWLSGRFAGPEQISLAELAQQIETGQVREIVVTGDRIQVTKVDDTQVGSVKDTRGSVYDALLT